MSLLFCCVFFCSSFSIPKEEGKRQLVVTMQEMDARLTDTLMYCADAMGISRDRVHVISHTESFVYIMC